MRESKAAGDIADYEESIIDLDEVPGDDVKIKPDYYMHICEIKIQEALIKENVRDGFLQYRILVDHMVLLARASDRLPKSFDSEVEIFEKSLKTLDDDARRMAIAGHKLMLVYKHVFKSVVRTDPMKHKGGRGGGEKTF